MLLRLNNSTQVTTLRVWDGKPGSLPLKHRLPHQVLMHTLYLRVFSASNHWGPGIELTSSGLVADDFTCWTSSLGVAETETYPTIWLWRLSHCRGRGHWWQQRPSDLQGWNIHYLYVKKFCWVLFYYIRAFILNSIIQDGAPGQREVACWRSHCLAGTSTVSSWFEARFQSFYSTSLPARPLGSASEA